MSERFAEGPCLDFPELVLHREGGKCGRYTGGVCHPIPAPSREEEPEEWANYERMLAVIKGERDMAPGERLLPRRSSGQTEFDESTASLWRKGVEAWSLVRGRICPTCGTQFKKGDRLRQENGEVVHALCFADKPEGE